VALRSQIIRQRDFSAGEVVPEAKRRDDLPQVRAASRTLRNWRIESAGNIRERPGRTAQFQQEGRTETVLMPGEVKYRVSFGYTGATGTIVVRDANGAAVAANSGYAWTLLTVRQISFAVINRDIICCFPGQKPKLVRRSAAGAWSFADFTFKTGSRGQPRSPYYRFTETAGITMRPSDRVGAVTLTFSAAFLSPSHVGVYLRYKGYAILITSYTSPTLCNAQIIEDLPLTQRLTFTSAAGFYVGDTVTGTVTGTVGEVIAVAATTIDVVLNSTTYAFTTADTCVGPSAKAGITVVAPIATGASVQWDEQAVSDYRGWPRSCLNDRSRLTFCDLPSLPEGILWSTIGSADDFYVGTDASSAMFEGAPGRARVLYMTGGADQYVFTSRGVYYIPISASNPLKPGGIEFRQISSESVGAVQPVANNDAIIYMNAGLTRVMGIIQTGLQARPYAPQDLSEMAYHLIKSPICLATSTGDGSFPERYIYVVNGDGSIAVGRAGADKKFVGWTPWDGNGAIEWVSSLASETLFTTVYSGNTVRRMVELLDDSADLDGQVTYNSVISTLAPPGGALTGPLWMFAGMTVDLTDGLKDLGQRVVDNTGALMLLGGDDFSSATITAGLAWTQTYEPFLPHVAEGPDFEQTMRVRHVRQIAVAVQRSVGFTVGPRTVPRYSWGEDAANQPAAREETFRFRRLKRTVDPRLTLTRDRPGSITINEVSFQVTV